MGTAGPRNIVGVVDMTKEILVTERRPRLQDAPGPCGSSATALLERLFQGVSRRQAQSAAEPEQIGAIGKRRVALAAGSQIALFAPDTPEFQCMKSEIKTLGGQARIIPETVLSGGWLRKHAPRLTCCIVGHDFADADAAVDFCLELRLVAPELVIILALAGVPRCDLSAERMPICEVTLRRPVSGRSLSVGIQAAFDNRASFERNRGHGVSSGTRMAMPWEGLVQNERYQSRA